MRSQHSLSTILLVSGSGMIAADAAAQSLHYNASVGSTPYGLSIRGVPDLDGDACDDIVVGKPSVMLGSSLQVGAVALLSGKTGTLIQEWTAGSIPGSAFGRSVTGIGDVDGDARGDFAVGMPQIDTLQPLPGAVWVYSGAAQTLLWTQAGSVGKEGYGASVSGLGDWNSDGVADLLVGAPNVSPALGHVHVRSGSNGALLADLTYSGFGPIPLGATVSGVGDLNGDGYVDAIASDARFNLVAWSGATGNVVYQQHEVPCPGSGCAGTSYANFRALSWAGDFDGDGHQDYIEGSTTFNGNLIVGSGKATVRSGFDHHVLAQFQSQLNLDGTGCAVAGLGDVDDDGFGDVLVGAPGIHPIGLVGSEARVYRGGSGQLMYELAPYSGPGFAASATLAGDVNADGVPDFAVTGANVDVFSSRPLALTSDLHVLSAAAGEVQGLKLASPAHASQPYLVAVTGSGTLPGTLVDGVLVPINVDALTLFGLQNINQPPYAGTFGLLDGSGNAQASLTLSAGTASGLVGMTLYHAFIVLNGAVVFASNAVPLTIAP